MKLPWLRRFLTAGLLAGAFAPLTQTAPIPKLFNTGVDDNGALLPNATVDPHYRLIESADAAYPGPDSFTLEPGWPVAPAGPWVADGPASRWIGPRARQSTGNAPGNYTYRTTFDLTGYDPTKARIAGQWTSDNAGLDIVLNGVSLGFSQAGNFGALSDFTIEFGFVAGVNTLDFVINNAGDAVNPAGLRVQMIGTVEVLGEPPRIVTAPVGGTYLVGEDVILRVVADGTPPLSYQWRRDGNEVGGATDATLNLPAVTTAQDGAYTVRVSNSVGEVVSDAVQVAVLDLLPGLYNTGVDNDRWILWDGVEDPHYRLTVNPDDPLVTAPIIQDSTVFPIVAGPWIANSDTSLWIGPRFETSGAAGGDYVYQLEVDLTGFNPATAFVEGLWATDNAGTLLVNDAPTGAVNAGNFDTLSRFRLEGIFLNGKNQLQFKVNNASAGYTGLRVQGLRGGAKKGTVGDAPRLVSQPAGKLLLTGESLELAVLADGAKPLSYQWRRNGVELAGQTNPKLPLSNVTRADAGTYTVVVSNFAGSITSADAVVTVLERVPRVYSTGVDDAGAVLADGTVDPHYRLVVNATNPNSQEAFVHDSTVFPIVAGPWVANTDRSKWIAPLMNSVDASGGDYAYRTTFDLTGFDLTTVVAMGNWATDNLGTDVKLNGQSTGLQNGNQFSAYTPFTLTSGFQAGVNTLEFLLNNADAITGYTGLRVDSLRVGALPLPAVAPSLAAQRSGNQILISWPANATGYKLFGSPALGATASWSEVTVAPVAAGDRLTVTVDPTAAQRFYRLQK
ncbi:MAG: immunoglobulin domain-containing protein [Verrucomicrobia bacterium]|nr:immunoglobulin domain-containing protein [Verrucomicrobiota bacterium]